MRPAQYRFIRDAMSRIYSTGTREDEHFFVPEKPFEVLLNDEEVLSSEVLAAEKPKEKRQIRALNKLPKNFTKNQRNSSEVFKCHYNWYQISQWKNHSRTF